MSNHLHSKPFKSFCKARFHFYSSLDEHDDRKPTISIQVHVNGLVSYTADLSDLARQF